MNVKKLLPVELDDMIDINTVRHVKPIKFFDILIDDVYSAGPDTKPQRIDSTTKLTFHEVLEFIGDGGDWIFVVTEHNKPDNVFISGITYESMRNAYKGEETGYYGKVSREGLHKIGDIVSEERRQICAREKAAGK